MFDGCQKVAILKNSFRDISMSEIEIKISFCESQQGKVIEKRKEIEIEMISDLPRIEVFC